jgi:hypothetical protein
MAREYGNQHSTDVPLETSSAQAACGLEWGIFAYPEYVEFA